MFLSSFDTSALLLRLIMNEARREFPTGFNCLCRIDSEPVKLRLVDPGFSERAGQNASRADNDVDSCASGYVWHCATTLIRQFQLDSAESNF